MALTTQNSQVSVLELRRLLFILLESRPDIGIRFRLIGEMWQSRHLRLVNVTEKGATLNDEKVNKPIYVQDLNQVMQFELDHAFQQYQPHFHYSVNLSE